MDSKCKCPLFKEGTCQAIDGKSHIPTEIDKERYCLSSHFEYCYILEGLGYTQWDNVIKTTPSPYLNFFQLLDGIV